MVSADSLLPDDVAGVGFEADRHAAFGYAVQVFAGVHERGDHRDTFLLFPGDGGFFFVAGRRSDGADGGLFEAGDGVDATVADYNGWNDAFALAVNGPEAFAILEAKSLHHVAGTAHEDFAAVDLHNIWGHMRDPAFPAQRFPADCAGLLVEREEEGLIPGNLPAEAFVFASAAVVKGH